MVEGKSDSLSCLSPPWGATEVVYVAVFLVVEEVDVVVVVVVVDNLVDLVGGSIDADISTSLFFPFLS